MSTISYAQKYSGIVDERFTLGRMTGMLGTNGYDWLGVEAVKVYSVDNSPLNDYKTSGTNRFGDPEELGNSVQTMTLSGDKSFTFTIDKKSEQDTVGTMEIGMRLRKEIDEVINPFLDQYNVNKIVAGAGNYLYGAVTKSNAMETFLSAQEVLDNKKVPAGGRICYAKPGFINKLKLDDDFTKACDIAQERLVSGSQAGEADGVPIIKMPASYFPTNVNFIILIREAIVAPVKLTEYRVLTEVQGISGAVAEGRVRFDAFVLNNKKDGIVVQCEKTLSSIAVTTSPTKTAYTSGDKFDPAGMKITATYTDNTTAVVTDACTFAPETITSAGDVTVSYTESGVTKTATQAVTIAS